MMEEKKIDRYEIKKELGRGGMATVYLAHDPRFERDVAVKALPREFLHDRQFRARFEREAKTIAALDHPAIVPVFDFGEHDGQPYLVMRYMAGGTLAERMAKSSIPLPDIVVILKEIAPGLDAAHKKGVVHRDMKPGNILFDAYDKAYVADFGVVKLAEATMTLTMGTIGTPQYMSPEQALGQQELDGRSDIYSLGVVAYQLLCGKLPFEAATPAGLIHAHVYDPPPDIQSINPEVPAAVKAVVEKALSKGRGDRYASTQEFAGALAEAVDLPATQVMDAAEEMPAAPETAVIADEPAAKPKEKVAPAKRGKAKKPPQKKRKARPAPRAGGGRRVPLWGWLVGTLALAGVIFVLYSSGLLAGGGEKIVFQSNIEGNQDIYVMGIDGSNITRLTENGVDDFSAAWSPDGSQIAFGSTRDGNTDIYVMDADGRNEIRLTENAADDIDAAWSPDGSRIAFATRRDGNFEIYLMDSDGSNKIRLTEDSSDDHFPAWSPDGSQIAFFSERAGSTDFFVMDADGSNATQMTDNPADDIFPDWSPDGSRIAFVSNRDGGTFEIFVMDADGGNQNRLTPISASGQGDDVLPAWSPDGSQIVFSSNRDGNMEIYIMDAGGGNQTRITTTVGRVEDAHPDWSP